MSRLRKFMLLSCLVLTTMLWAWAFCHAHAHTGLPTWPIQLWAVIGLVNAVASTDLSGRRALLSASLLLLASVVAVQSWPIQMPYEDWLSKGMLDKPTVWAKVHLALSLRWVHGCSTLPWPAWLLVAPFCLGTQFINGKHPVMPAWSRALAHVAVACWAITLLLALGMVMVDMVKDAPFWFWGLLLLLLPLQVNAIPMWLLLPAWLSSLAGLIAAVTAHVISLGYARDATLALAVTLTLVNWLVWYVRMDAILRFDSVLEGLRELFPQPPASPAVQELEMMADPVADSTFDWQAYLDSPQAQEGADKYTRE